MRTRPEGVPSRFALVKYSVGSTVTLPCHQTPRPITMKKELIQTRNRNCEGPPGVKGVKAVDKADNKEGDDKKVKGARDTKNNQEKITKK